MRLEDLQSTATRAWRIHLVRCSLMALLLLVVPFARQLRFFYSLQPHGTAAFGGAVRAASTA